MKYDVKAKFYLPPRGSYNMSDMSAFLRAAFTNIASNNPGFKCNYNGHLKLTDEEIVKIVWVYSASAKISVKKQNLGAQEVEGILRNAFSLRMGGQMISDIYVCSHGDFGKRPKLTTPQILIALKDRSFAKVL